MPTASPQPHGAAIAVQLAAAIQTAAQYDARSRLIADAARAALLRFQGKAVSSVYKRLSAAVTEAILRVAPETVGLRVENVANSHWAIIGYRSAEDLRAGASSPHLTVCYGQFYDDAQWETCNSHAYGAVAIRDTARAGLTPALIESTASRLESCAEARRALAAADKELADFLDGVERTRGFPVKDNLSRAIDAVNKPA